MADGGRQFFDTNAGRAVAAALCIAGIAAIWFVLTRGTKDTETAQFARQRTFICAQTLKPFDHELKAGETFPVISPHSGKPTGYPAELCYWTQDGKVREKPYPILLNTYINQPEPTFCPDCQRLVIPHNPAPQPGQPAPPTREEYQAAPGIFGGPTTEPVPASHPTR